jgi:hypothetical protein
MSFLNSSTTALDTLLTLRGGDPGRLDALLERDRPCLEPRCRLVLSLCRMFAVDAPLRLDDEDFRVIRDHGPWLVSKACYPCIKDSCNHPLACRSEMWQSLLRSQGRH